MVDEGGVSAVRARAAAQLQHKLEQHQRVCKPFTISCMDPAEPSGDCVMLHAFSAQVTPADMF